MQKEIHQIYDKIFKRTLTLSKVAVINFINGMFGKAFPLDSELAYNWNENINDKLERTVSDTILTINQTEKFHLEVQINNDATIVLRMFGYGYQDALKYKRVSGNRILLRFPEPKIIFLEHDANTPDEVILDLDLLEQGRLEYKIPTMKFLDYSVEELSQKNMVILLPLYLLKLRRAIKKEKSTENARALKFLIEDGIIKAIEENGRHGNICHDDVVVLIGLLKLLYENLYGEIEGFKREGVDSMITEKLVLFSDEVEEKAKREIAKKLLESGVGIDTIAEATRLSKEDIYRLMEV